MNIVSNKQQLVNSNLEISSDQNSLRQGDNKRRQMFQDCDFSFQKKGLISEISDFESEEVKINNNKSHSINFSMHNLSNQNLIPNINSSGVVQPPSLQNQDQQMQQLSLFSVIGGGGGGGSIQPRQRQKSSQLSKIQQNPNSYSNQDLQNQPKKSNASDFKQLQSINDEAIFEANKKKIEQNLYTFIHLIHLLLKFIKNLNKLIIWRKLNLLQKHHYQLIGDLSQGNEGNQQAKFLILSNLCNSCSIILQNIDKVISELPIFQPDSLYTTIIDIFMLLLIIFEFLTIPIMIAFPVSQCLLIFQQQCVPFLFIIEIFFTLNRGIYFQGSLCTDRKTILKQYVRQRLLVDIIAVAGLFNRELKLILFYVKFPQMINLINQLDDIYQLRQKFLIAFQMIKLALLILTMANFCGCGFHYIYQIEKEYGVENTWIEIKGLQDSEPNKQYLFSLYYAIITMVTVGYGDITPQTQYEVMYVIVMTLISSAVFAYSINTIGMIFNDLAQKESQFRKKKVDLQNYLSQRNISKQVEIKMLRYLQYIESQDTKDHLLGESILANISKNLREEFNQEYFGNILKSSKIFKLNFSEQFIDSLAQSGIKEMTLAPDDIVFKEGQQDSNLYFVVSGIIEVYVEKNKKKILVNRLEKGAVIGYEGFFGNQNTEFSVRSLLTSKLVFCNRTDFLKVINNFPLDFEKYCYIKDSLIFSNKKIDTKCTSCGEYSHSFKRCPLIHLQVNRYTLIGKYTKDLTRQYRTLYQRPKQGKENSLEILHIVKMQQRRYIIKLMQELGVGSQIQQYLNEEMTDMEFSINLPFITFKNNTNQPQILINSDMSLSEVEVDFVASQQSKENTLTNIGGSGDHSNQSVIDLKQATFNNIDQDQASATMNNESINEIELLLPVTNKFAVDKQTLTAATIAANSGTTIGVTNDNVNEYNQEHQASNLHTTIKVQQINDVQIQLQHQQQQTIQTKVSDLSPNERKIGIEKSPKVNRHRASIDFQHKRNSFYGQKGFLQDNGKTIGKEDNQTSKFNKTEHNSTQLPVLSQLFNYNFEEKKNYSKYFPQFNFNTVIEQYIKYQTKQEYYQENMRKKKQTLINQINKSPLRIHSQNQHKCNLKILIKGSSNNKYLQEQQSQQQVKLSPLINH